MRPLFLFGLYFVLKKMKFKIESCSNCDKINFEKIENKRKLYISASHYVGLLVLFGAIFWDVLYIEDKQINYEIRNYSEIINSWNNIYKAYSVDEFEEKISIKKFQQKDTTEKQKSRTENGKFYEEIKNLNKHGYPNSIIALKLNIDEKKVKQTVRLLEEKNDPHLLTSLYKTIINVNTGIKTTSSNTYVFRFGKNFNGKKRKTIEESTKDKVKILLEKTLSYPFLNNLIKETYNV